MKGHNKLLCQRTDIHHCLLLSWIWCSHFMLYHPVSLKSSWKLFSQLCLGLHIHPFPSASTFPHPTRVCVHFSTMHATCQLTFVVNLLMFVGLYFLTVKLLALQLMCVLHFEYQDIRMKKIVVKMRELCDRISASPLCFNWHHSNTCSEKTWHYVTAVRCFCCCSCLISDFGNSSPVT